MQSQGTSHAGHLQCGRQHDRLKIVRGYISARQTRNRGRLDQGLYFTVYGAYYVGSLFQSAAGDTHVWTSEQMFCPHNHRSRTIQCFGCVFRLTKESLCLIRGFTSCFGFSQQRINALRFTRFSSRKVLAANSLQDHSRQRSATREHLVSFVGDSNLHNPT